MRRFLSLATSLSLLLLAAAPAVAAAPPAKPKKAFRGTTSQDNRPLNTFKIGATGRTVSQLVVPMTVTCFAKDGEPDPGRILTVLESFRNVKISKTGKLTAKGEKSKLTGNFKSPTRFVGKVTTVPLVSDNSGMRPSQGTEPTTSEDPLRDRTRHCESVSFTITAR